MSDRVREVIVLGGGISGLTAAWRLKAAGVDVHLIEASDAVGGCTRTERRDGFLLEKGPFNVMVRDPSFERLIDDMSGDVQVVSSSPAAKNRYIYRGCRLLKVPTNPISLLTTPLLGFGGRLRLMSGLFLSAKPRRAEETIEQAATRRFGRQTADNLVSAVISGIFAGDIRILSLNACFPPVGEIDAKTRSFVAYGLTSALRSKRDGKPKRRRKWRGLVSIDGGLGALTGAIGDRLGGDLVTNCPAKAIRPIEDGYFVDCAGDGDGSRTFRCRRLVLAVDAPEAGRLLEPVVPDATRMLQSIESASLCVLSLGFHSGDVGHPMQGFGFLVPHNEPDFPLMGALFADSVFPHHAPSDHRLLRVFIGGARDPGASRRSDEDLLRIATDAIRDLLQVRGDPILVDICRYETAIPQYHLGHVGKIQQLRAMVAKKPNLHLIGNYLDGVSLNDCVRLGTRMAEELTGDGTET